MRVLALFWWLRKWWIPTYRPAWLSPQVKTKFLSRQITVKVPTMSAEDAFFELNCHFTYSRDFLVRLQGNPLSMSRPRILPDLEIINKECILRKIPTKPFAPTDFWPPKKRLGRANEMVFEAVTLTSERKESSRPSNKSGLRPVLKQIASL